MKRAVVTAVMCVCATVGVSGSVAMEQDTGAATRPVAATTGPTLRRAASGVFPIGVAIAPKVIRDDGRAALAAAQFDHVTIENHMKPALVQPEPGVFTFEAADEHVRYAEAYGLAVYGHTLVWHNQMPKWMFETPDGTPLDREKAVANLRAHILAVAGRYRGRVRAWDVVNEAIRDDDHATEFLRDTPARKAIGDDYLALAYTFAREADPAALLVYNDYNNELPGKRTRTLKLLKDLEARGVKVDAVGMQLHLQLGWPSVKVIEESIVAYHEAGYRVMVTELDVDVLPRRRPGGADLGAVEKGDPTMDPFTAGLNADTQTALAKRYRELFEMLVRHRDKIDRVTFWNLDDGTSWLNNFPVRGRTNHPLLIDRILQPKPAFEEVVRVLREAGR